MPRSWENSRWRKLTRQAVLCASLAMTMALAWWIGHVRAAGLRVELADRQTFENLVLPIEVRLPQMPGWTVGSTEPDQRFARLTITEQTGKNSARRVLLILLQRLHGTSLDPEQVVAKGMDGRFADRTEKFEFFGQTGILSEYDLDFGQKPGTQFQPAVLYACVIVPGPKPTALCVGIVCPYGFTPSDIDLFKRVAQAISPVNPAHKAPIIPKDTEDLRPHAVEVNPSDSGDTTNNNDDGQ